MQFQWWICEQVGCCRIAALHIWRYADSLFALTHHQSVDSVTGICFCILKSSACGGNNRKETFTDWALNAYWFLSLFLSAAFLFHFPPVLVLIISCHFSFPLFFVHHISSLHFLFFPPHPAHSLCFVIPITSSSSWWYRWAGEMNCSNAGMEKYRGGERDDVNIDLG